MDCGRYIVTVLVVSKKPKTPHAFTHAKRSKHTARIHTNEQNPWSPALLHPIDEWDDVETQAPVLWRYTLELLNGIREKNGLGPMGKKETVGLNFMIQQIRSTFELRQERLFGFDRQMAENDLNEIITMSHELLIKVFHDSKVSALLDKAWDEVDSLETYGEKNTRLELPIKGDSTFDFERYSRHIRRGVEPPNRQRSGIDFPVGYASLFKKLSAYRFGPDFRIAAIYQLLQLYRLACHAASTLDETPKGEPLLIPKQFDLRSETHFYNDDFDEWLGVLISSKMDAAIDSHWAVLRLCEVVEIFGGKSPATMWGVAPLAAIWRPWFEYTSGYKFIRYRFELAHEIGWWLYQQEREQPHPT